MYSPGIISWADAERLIEENSYEISSPELVAEPLLSVAVITFRHSEFLRQALDAILSQKTDFPFEVVIGDDCSDDGAFEILEEYQKNYPEQVRVLGFEENLGHHTANGRLNWIRTNRACRGKYIALQEADDYWTHDGKLQAQVDLLESDDTLSASMHCASIYDERLKETVEVYPSPPFKERFNLLDTIDHTKALAATASLVYRNSEELPFPKWVLHAFAIDRFIYTVLSTRGDIGFIGKTWSVYRRHNGGVTSIASEYCQVHFRIFYFRNIHRVIGRRPETERLRGWQLAHFYIRLSGYCRKDRKFGEMFRHLGSATWLFVSPSLSFAGKKGFLGRAFTRVSRSISKKPVVLPS